MPVGLHVTVPENLYAALNGKRCQNIKAERRPDETYDCFQYDRNNHAEHRAVSLLSKAKIKSVAGRRADIFYVLPEHISTKEARV